MVAKKIKLFIYCFISCLLLSISACKSNPPVKEVKNIESKFTNEIKSEEVTKTIHKAGVPDEAYEVAKYVETYHKAPKGYVGGREFENREHRLPNLDKSKHQIVYQEFDIHPKMKGINRGAERIILGNNLSRYYTANHYKTFIEF
ncbi:MAG: ribonuclease domain-containing protein [Bacteroidota bacterium]